MITQDPNAGTANWVFFAVTYDGTLTANNVNYYWGSPTQLATLDPASPLTYNQGVCLSSGTLTVGNFGTVVMGARTPTGPTDSRCFRGLVDELNVFSGVLSLADIQAAQTAPAGIPTVRLNATLRAGQRVISWNSPGTFELQYSENLATGTWTAVPTAPIVNGTQNTVTLPATGPARFYRLMGF
jgi:hypothetical protein